MNSEKLKQIIINHPYLMKITPSTFSKVFKDYTGEYLDYTKTYGEQGLDGLDLIEMIMNIEKELNIHIHDELTDTIFSSESYPINFTLWHREERLGELGI
jgi:acyl carrier protein